jgi:two-component system, chemotaxis family, CheB/CheR fusion protein
MGRHVMGKSDPAIPGGRGGFLPIVGVGASAGGLEAFTELLKHLPLDTGMGFVLVQHLDPQHESALTQLLARATSLPVHEVTNNLRVEANQVYVIPPNTNLDIAEGVLKLRPRKNTRTPHHSIDAFFEALAADQRERAIGVVLSGTASDGTLGLEAIKAEGGITFAQDDSARYDSMPRSAVSAGCVDFVLSPREIAHELARIAKHPCIAAQAAEASTPEDDRASATEHEDDQAALPSGGRGSPPLQVTQARAEAARPRKGRSTTADEGFKKILQLLRNHCGVDFSLYKSTTIQRRVTRRMVLNRQDSPEGYAGFLRGNAKELDALYSDVLISVTSFFRNPEAFEVLKRKVFSKFLQEAVDDPFRIWVIGCSTGQEAYSLAMAFVEAAEKAPRARKLQVFATDLNDALLEKARHGLYSKSLADDVSPERLRRFFVAEEGGYRILKSLREMVVFARQNLISDPPFSRLELISCRNLLIYLEPNLQKTALPTFHYALKPGGHLFLGASESIGGFGDLFEAADKKQKIYTKKAVATPSLRLTPKGERSTGAGQGAGTRPAAPLEEPPGSRSELNVQREADRVTINQYAPPGVLVNSELEILQFRGPTSAYLEPPTGKASFDVLKMAREGLMLPLRAALNRAKKENKPIRKEHVQVEQNGATRAVNLEVIPLRNLRERCFLILFEDSKSRDGRKETQAAVAVLRSTQPVRPANKTKERRHIAQLESDLSETRDYVQSLQEQYEAANEELQASNEEVQSANEELQSINEELETSKEELESTNEELTTVNEEMANRNVELNRLNSDLMNLQVSTKLAIVLLGRDLTIRRFSGQAERQFNLLASDVGRSIGHIRHNLQLPELESVVAEVIDSVREQEREVQDREGRWFSLQVHPYLTIENKVDGAVLVLVDIDSMKRSEEAIAAARNYAEAVIRTIPNPLVVLDAKLRVQTANEAFYRLFKASPADSENRLIYEIGNRQWDIPGLRELLEDILPHNSVIEAFEVTHDFEGIGRRSMLLNARLLREGEDLPAKILLGIQDISERKRAETAQADLTDRLATELNSSQRLQETSTRLIHGHDVDALYQEILDAATAIMGSEMASMQMVDEEQDALRLLAWRGFDSEFAESFALCRSDARTSCTLARRTGQRVVVPDVEICEFMVGTPALAQHRKFGIRTVQSTPLVSREGRILGMISTHWRTPHEPAQRDLRLLDVLARQAADLIERVHSEEAIIDADRHKSEFLAMLAHELRNPLAPIRNMAHILRTSHTNPDEVQAAAEMMERQIGQMVRLVDDLLDVSRISRGKIELRTGRVELASAVNHAVEAAGILAQCLGQELVVSLPPDPIYLSADPTRLAQIVGNLLNNACKFTDKGGRIEVIVQRANREAVIRVRDTGIGISGEDLPRIFDMFTQIDTSLERTVSGLGIGLTLVKNLVEMHGGTVDVQSAGAGQGSEFVVRLPMLLEAQPPPPTAGRRVAPSPTIKYGRILVVDDNRDSATSLAMLLKLSADETRIAHDGIEAVEAAATFKPDVILMDIGLPKLNGYEACHRIRDTPWGTNIVMIALTGWGQDEDRQKSKDARFDAHLVKPVEYTVLMKLLTELLSSAKS